MNNARIWLVVHPTVGIPIFLGAVATASLIVHGSILTHTTWFPAFLQGGQKGKAAMALPATKSSDTAALTLNGEKAVVVFDNVAQSQEAVVVLPDGRTARVTFDNSTAPTAVAALAPPKTE